MIEVPSQFRPRCTQPRLAALLGLVTGVACSSSRHVEVGTPDASAGSGGAGVSGAPAFGGSTGVGGSAGQPGAGGAAAGSSGNAGTAAGGTAGNAGASGSYQGDVFRGGLVWDNWTKTNAGGTGLPAGVDYVDFVRCKACHGWDALGRAGGYVRRTSMAARPAPIAGVSDLGSKLGTITEAAVWYPAGRVWTVFDDSMPNYTQTGGLTAQQVADLLAYLNAGPKVQDVATLDVSANPVGYTFTGADTTAGATAYASRCQACHGSDGTLIAWVPVGAYLNRDGSYSELFHKLLYGVADGYKTRAMMGSPSKEQVRDILAYIQANIGSTFPPN
jgi:cytochrome c553